MKKVFSLVLALVICVSLACPVFADTFTPSVSYKDSPVIVDADMDGEDVTDCLVATSVQQAKKKSTDITQEERDLLIDVYEKLSDGSMKVDGLSDDYVIRDLMDLSFEYADCRVLDDHGQKDEKLKQEGITLEVVLDLGIGKKTDVVVMTYIDGKWQPIESVKNNGDGTLTCVFEDICPVLFAVKDADQGSQGSQSSNPKTGDTMGQERMLWTGMMVFAAAALAVTGTISRKRK